MTCNNLDHYNNTWPSGETATGLPRKKKKTCTHTHTQGYGHYNTQSRSWFSVQQFYRKYKNNSQSHKMAVTSARASSQSSNYAENTNTKANVIHYTHTHTHTKPQRNAQTYHSIICLSSYQSLIFQ